MSREVMEVLFRVVELRARHAGEPEADRLIASVQQWLDDWEAFERLPWYRQYWLTLRGRLPTYDRPSFVSGEAE